MKNLLRNPARSAVILIVAVVIAGFISQTFFNHSANDPKAAIQSAAKKLVELKDQSVQTLEQISSIGNAKDLSTFFRMAGREKTGLSYYVLINGKLMYWSDNEPAISDSLLNGIKSNELLHLPNGDFLACKIIKGARTFIGLILIKHRYEYENRYLVNKFNPVIGLADNFREDNDGDALHLPGNDFVYKLKYDNVSEQSSSSGSIVLFFLLYFLLLTAAYLLFIHFSGSVVKSALIIAGIILLRTLSIYMKVPSAMYDHQVFSPQNYASSFYFNSLGDMLLNAMLILLFGVSLYRNVKPGKRFRVFYFVVWLASAIVIHFLIRGLVINSKISFELSSPSDITIYGILAFTSVSMLLLSFLFVTAATLRKYFNYEITGRNAWMGITICALYTAIALSGMNREKEHEIRKLIAQKAEMRQDHVAEFLFDEAEDKISADTIIPSIIHAGTTSNEALSSYISQKYFNGYLSKYELSIRSFDGKSNPDSNINLDYYRNLAGSGKSTNAKWLYFIDNGGGGSSYLAIVPLNEKPHEHFLVITMTARFLHSEKGFPELFISGNYRDASPSEDYSIARYSGHSLVYEYGNYVYSLTGKDFPETKEEFFFTDLNGYCHLIYHINEQSFIVVSRPQESLLGVLTLFSWMFTFMSVLAFLVLAIAAIIGEEPALQWNLTRRVQASVIFLVVLTFVLVGSGTVYYINRKYNTEQKKSISDQVNAIWFMVNENVFANRDNPRIGDADKREQLDRLVSNTNIDFNIFSGDGKMVYSSQPKIFDTGIVSDRMNPGAYFNIKEKGVTQYIHRENAGELRYISAYAPFTDRSGNIISFLNLPYFEKQNELNREVSVFLSALVNIYVLLFALAVFVTIFISSRITKPLLLIQEKMSNIRLGTANEKIEYREKDEIGRLVHEYNRMIDELAISADKLARGERESAWREMARQVAHEIKNPLTPMKLSVQHLYRTFKEKGNDPELLERITTTLVQQIDTLANIASAFSNFAKMPQAIPVRTDLKELIAQISQLYADGCDIEITGEGEFFVMADRDQMNAIFSNLLKNAQQSIPPERRGRIAASLRHEGGEIVVEIADNGIGILEDQRDKIFTPNFTTKSSGMGLGLAIVRNIVQEASGTIWFTSTYNVGTSFFVRLPAAR